MHITSLAPFPENFHHCLSLAVRYSGYSRKQIAAALEIAPEKLSAMLDGNAEITIRDMADICWATGFNPEFSLKPRGKAETDSLHDTGHHETVAGEDVDADFLRSTGHPKAGARP